MTNQVIAKRRDSKRIAAAALAGVVAIAGGVALTSALFTAEDSVDQSVGTATIAISAETATGAEVLAVDDLLPGDTEETTVTVSNTGTAGVYYQVSLPQVTGVDAGLAAAIEVTIAVDGLSETRTLTGWQAGSWQVGTELDAADSQDITVTVELNIDADDALQGKDASFAVQIDAHQARNVTAPTAGWTTP